MQTTTGKYAQTHSQILFDLLRFYGERIKHYEMLDRLVEAYQAEYDEVRSVLLASGYEKEVAEIENPVVREMPQIDPRYTKQLQPTFGFDGVISRLRARLRR